MSKKNLTKRSVIKEAYYMKNPHLREKDKIPDLSNDNKRINELLESLYYCVNGTMPNDKEREFEYNIITKSIVTALSLMDGHSGSFIYNLKNRKFDEITEEQKIEFLVLVYQHLLSEFDKEDSWWRKNIPSQECLQDYFSYLDYPKGSDYSEVYLDFIKEELEKKFFEIKDDLDVSQYIKIKQKKTDDLIKSAIEDCFSTNILGGVLFPTEYIKPEDRYKEPMIDVFNVLQSKEVFDKPELSLLDYDEKIQLLDKLFDKISVDIYEWKETINKILKAKIEDSSLLIEEIIEDY